MKTVINKTQTPLKLPLPRGKSLHLGPRQSGQIRNEAAEHPALKKLIEAGKIEFVDREGPERNAGWQGSAPHESTHAQGKATFKQKTGDR
jgi:hypothetical protein